MNPAYPRIAPLLAACVLLTAGCTTTGDSPPVVPSVVVMKGEAPVAARESIQGDIFDISKLDRPPAPVSQVPPRYPFDLRRAGVSGEALVDFIVDSQGTVRNAHAVRATHPAFGAAAVASVVQWRFKPGIKDGRPVNTHMQVPLVFSLN